MCKLVKSIEVLTLFTAQDYRKYVDVTNVHESYDTPLSDFVRELMDGVGHIEYQLKECDRHNGTIIIRALAYVNGEPNKAMTKELSNYIKTQYDTISIVPLVPFNN